MTSERHQQIYTTIFEAMLSHHALSLPLQVNALCDSLGLELYPLSKITSSIGLHEEAVFRIWGNKDGTVMQFNDRTKIAYNDSLPRGRIRFTICEEISHFLLGHVNNPDFNVFNQQYASSTYRQYEEEARIGAGLLLCQPQFFYTNTELLEPILMSYLCDITGPCAEVRCDILTKFRASITCNPIFRLLPQPSVHKRLRGSYYKAG